MSIHPGHALVAGGSVAGLLAARVLSEYFGRVTLVERDVLSPFGEARKGVPQGRHIHALLVRGRWILEALFPGMVEELRAAGAVVINSGCEFGWHHGGSWRASYESDLFLLSMSRPLLEHRIAERVRALPNVSTLSGVRVEGFIKDRDGAVSGVRVVVSGDARNTDEIAADLVVDAMGRGSMTTRCLAELGFAAPETELLPARVTYATCLFRRPEEWPGRHTVHVTGAPAKRSGGLAPIEGGRWLLTLISFFDEPTPRDHEEFLGFARSLDVPDIHDAIRDLEPVSDIVHYRFAGSQRRRYERLKRFPKGLIVVGDAVCSFNPVYGQGMTVSALEAECLENELVRTLRGGAIDAGFGRRWFRAIRPTIDAAWDGVMIEDLRFPELAARRPARLRALQWYMDRVNQATYHSAAAADRFYRVVNFIDPPARLFGPRMLAEALFSGRRRVTAVGRS